MLHPGPSRRPAGGRLSALQLRACQHSLFFAFQPLYDHHGNKEAHVRDFVGSPWRMWPLISTKCTDRQRSSGGGSVFTNALHTLARIRRLIIELVLAG